jgi:hypothetical protein
MSDLPPDWIAAIDQALRGVADVARLVRAYYAALVEAGFAVEEALALTLAYQTTILQSASS